MAENGKALHEHVGGCHEDDAGEDAGEHAFLGCHADRQPHAERPADGATSAEQAGDRPVDKARNRVVRGGGSTKGADREQRGARFRGGSPVRGHHEAKKGLRAALDPPIGAITTSGT